LDHSISKITCYKSKNNEWFIELYYSNLGNCPACEYYELYNFIGNLIATDREKLRVIYKHDSNKVIESKNFNKVLKKGNSSIYFT
jgi:NAD+--asparagine ADP-ribosyltransferase